MAKKIRELERRPHRNPYGITSGLFGSALMAFILITHYRLGMIDSTFIVIAVVGLFAFGGAQVVMQKQINGLLDDMVGILKLSAHQNDLLKMTAEKEKIRLELIQKLNDKVEIQDNLLKLYEKKDSIV